jgi:hypothetical protein
LNNEKIFLANPMFYFSDNINNWYFLQRTSAKDLPKEKVSETKIVSDGQPKLIKTQGSQKSDNVNSSLQDKAGNLWFGTTKRRPL